MDDDDNLEVSYMYKLECHDCGQTKLGPIIHKFRNNIKKKMSTDYKAKFTNVFNAEKKALLEKHKGSEILERIIYEIKDKRTYRVSAQRARAKCFPSLPKSHKDIDLEKIGLKHLELGRSSDFYDVEEENKDIILLGTPATAEAWARSEFKSGDGTFKICPKEFYQVNFELRL